MPVVHTYDWSQDFTQQSAPWHTAQHPRPAGRTTHLSDQQPFLRQERSAVKCPIMEAMVREEEIIEVELESEEERQQEQRVESEAAENALVKDATRKRSRHGST